MSDQKELLKQEAESLINKVSGEKAIVLHKKNDQWLLIASGTSIQDIDNTTSLALLYDMWSDFMETGEVSTISEKIREKLREKIDELQTTIQNQKTQRDALIEEIKESFADLESVGEDLYNTDSTSSIFRQLDAFSD